MLTKKELDLKVARLLGMQPSEVSLVTEAFLREACNALIQKGRVNLDGLGLLRLQRTVHNKEYELCRLKGSGNVVSKVRLMVKYKYHVYFTKSSSLKERLRRLKGRARVVKETFTEEKK